MKLSIILIAYDMARDYEVILVDNGSPTPLDPQSWSHVDVPVRLVRIKDASHSPASAINVALAQATGEITCLMIDGAHLLTPGVFRMALASFAAFESPVVATRYFGPDTQNDSIVQGYSKTVEDQLLQDINWPDDGYRLYEIGTPLRAGAENINWLNRMFESNCLFMLRSVFQEIGGADEQFTSPGGGLINSDIFKRAADASGVTPVQLIGEGSFHQLHGGTTTNVSAEERNARVAKFRQEYAEIRGHDKIMTEKTFHFMGHLPTQASKIPRLRW